MNIDKDGSINNSIENTNQSVDAPVTLENFVFISEDLFPKVNDTGDFSEESQNLLAKISLEKFWKEGRASRKYMELIPSGLPQDIGLRLANLLQEANAVSVDADSELKKKSRQLCDEGIRATDRLMEKRISSRYFPHSKEIASDLIQDTKNLCGLLEHGVWALKKLKEERQERDLLSSNVLLDSTQKVAAPPRLQPNLKRPATARESSCLSESDIKGIRRRLFSSIRDWLPDVIEDGERYLARSPFRADNSHGSFVIYPDGRAYDFATSESYDTIDMWAAVNGLTLGDAFKALAEKYGSTPAVTKVRPPASKASHNIPPDNFPDPNEAFFVHEKHGKPSQVYCYKNLQGQTIGFVARFDTPDQERKKHFCPVSFTHDAQGRPIWKKTIEGWNGVVPIYGLENLKARPDAPILIVEGEKTVAAAAKLFPDHIVLTWQGGSGNAAKANWSLLAGRTVEFIWPDADQKRDKKTGELLSPHQQPGMKAALQIAEALGNTGCKPKVVIPPTGVEDGWDLADALEEGWTAQRAHEYATSNAQAPASILSESKQIASDETQDGVQSEIRWRSNDIIADLRIRFDQEVEQGSFEMAFPFAAEFRNYIPISSQNTRVAAPILVSVSDKGQVREIDIKIFVNQLVRWYDKAGRLNYGKVNLTEDQLATLGRRMALRLPDIGGEPLIFKKTKDPGYAWNILDVESYLDRDEFKSLPATRYEAEQFSMEFLRIHCPSWHSQFLRMNNRLAMLCYLGSALDLKAKPQQYLWLKGNGGDGKSAILNVLKKFFGGAAIVTDWPTNPDKFYTERFQGRRLGMIDEASGACVTTDMWKRLTGSGTITIEPKGKQAYEILNNLLLIVSSNDRPYTKTRRSDLRRLIFSEVMPFNTIPHARFDELLIEEFSDFISLCQALWAKFRGISDLAPVDEDVTRLNLEEVHAKVSEFLQEYFEIMDMERIRKALDCSSFAKNAIPHILNRELEKACRSENIDYVAARDYLVGLLQAVPGQVSYSRMDKPRVIFGVVAKPALRKKLGLEDRSFELWPTFSRNLIES